MLRTMNLFRGWVFGTLYGDEFNAFTRLLADAREVIGLQKEQMKRQELEYTKAMLNIALGWRISQEMPEIDHREELDAAIQDLHDQVARLEEHTC